MSKRPLYRQPEMIAAAASGDDRGADEFGICVERNKASPSSARSCVFRAMSNVCFPGWRSASPIINWRIPRRIPCREEKPSPGFQPEARAAGDLTPPLAMRKAATDGFSPRVSFLRHRRFATTVRRDAVHSDRAVRPSWVSTDRRHAPLPTR